MKYSALLFLFPFYCFAMELETDSYIISIDSQCEEGEVMCQNYFYSGRSKSSGDSIILQGSSWHLLCADGVSPCRFLGYKFLNGDVAYYVTEGGLLKVIQSGEKVLVSEQGTWKD